MIASAFPLSACGGSTRSGSPLDLRLDAPPPELVQEIAEPIRLPARDMTQAEVERAWKVDRAALKTGRERFRALIRFYSERDAALRMGTGQPD